MPLCTPARSEADAGATIRPEPATTVDAIRLCAALDIDLGGRYPGEEPTHFEPSDSDADDGSFLIARDADLVAIGCVALRRYAPGVGEVKRMYVAEAWRGHGLGRRLLDAIEAEASRLGYPRIILETGTAQPEAMALYESAGYERIPPYGQFVDHPATVCFAKAVV